MPLLRDLGEPESWKIGGDDSIPVSQTWNQLPVLKGRCREAMQQEHYRSVRCAGFPVEDGYTVGFDAVDGRVRHQCIPSCGLCVQSGSCACSCEKGSGLCYKCSPIHRALLLLRVRNGVRISRLFGSSLFR
jgi:hypothetical protein